MQNELNPIHNGASTRKDSQVAEDFDVVSTHRLSLHFGGHHGANLPRHWGRFIAVYTMDTQATIANMGGLVMEIGTNYSGDWTPTCSLFFCGDSSGRSMLTATQFCQKCIVGDQLKHARRGLWLSESPILAADWWLQFCMSYPHRRCLLYPYYHCWFSPCYVVSYENQSASEKLLYSTAGFPVLLVYLHTAFGWQTPMAQGILVWLYLPILSLSPWHP